MSATLEPTDTEMRVAGGVARRIVRIQHGLIDYDDVRSECLMWLVTHPDRVERWRDEGKVGKSKLGTALYRAGMRWATRERATYTKTHVSDHAFYSEALLMEILPSIYDYDDWVLDAHDDDTQGRRPSRPGEGNTRLAMLVDVKHAVAGLTTNDQELLFERFGPPAMSVERMAMVRECHETTMRRHIRNTLRKLADRLGGEPPWM